MISPYRHALGRKALSAALRGRSWIDAHDTPTPALSAIRGAFAASTPDALALVESQLTRDSMPPPSSVPPLQRRHRYR